MGVSTNEGYLTLGVLTKRLLLLRVLHKGPLFSETPIFKGSQCSLGFLKRVPSACSGSFKGS